MAPLLAVHTSRHVLNRSNMAVRLAFSFLFALVIGNSLAEKL
jgi:hypothetical protein